MKYPEASIYGRRVRAAPAEAIGCRHGRPLSRFQRQLPFQENHGRADMPPLKWEVPVKRAEGFLAELRVMCLRSPSSAFGESPCCTDKGNADQSAFRVGFGEA